jgi:N-acetylmuramoyl-L-alanine amidase
MSTSVQEAIASVNALRASIALSKTAPEQKPQADADALQSLLAFSYLRQQVRNREQNDQNPNRVKFGADEQLALQEVLNLVSERALAIAKADGIAIALAEGNAILCRATKGAIAPDAGIDVSPSSGVSGECLVTGKIIRCDDAEKDSRVDPAVCRRLRVRSMIAVPIAGRRSVIGLIEAFSGRPAAFQDAHVEQLELLAELILAAIKPEEEDRMAEIARQVIAPAARQLEVARQFSAPAPRAIAVDTAVESKSETAVVNLAAVSAEDQARREDPPARSWWGLAVVGLLIAAFAGVGAWWKSHQKPVAAAIAQPTPTAVTQAVPVAPAADPIEQSTGAEPTPDVDASLGAISEVTGIRHWSSPESSTVVIDLQDQVQYEAHRLSNPERIYFDLHDTKMAPNVPDKAVEVNDVFLLRLRTAQQAGNITRVVLETKGTPNFSVSLEQNPYRLIVEVRSANAKPEANAKGGLFGPSSMPSLTDSPAIKDAKFRLALDAGHGGWDLGTVGRKGLLEKDLVLDVVARLGKLVQDRLGVQVVYTRKDDSYLPLEKRTEAANLAHADLLLSVHANYSDFPSARGVETYYTNTYSSVRARSESDPTPAESTSWTNVDIRAKVTESKRFASLLQKSLYRGLSEGNPGLRNRGVKQASYVVLTGATMPAVLAEVSFVSSPADETKLKSEAYRQDIAEALYKGIAEYVSSARQVQLAKALR